jgi:glycosyltransferase involved in cell wall biosynthesis
VLFVGRGRLTLPLPAWLAKKWDAIEAVLDYRVLNAGSGPSTGRFRLLPAGAAGFYSQLPLAVAQELRTFSPEVVVASDPYVAAEVLAGRVLARSRAKVIVEVHGDPQTFTRLYGSGARKLLSPLADMVSEQSLRRADATRALSAFTSSLVERARGVPATACFPTYSDLTAFSEPELVPVPDARRIVFVGALEPYKNLRGLAAAWRRVAAEDREATLTIVGNGSQRALVDELVRDLPDQVVHRPQLPPEGVAAELDAARALVLPSWPEGLGRVVLEAFARARTVVATDAGGIPDMVTAEHDGILIPAADDDALVEGLRRVLGDRTLAERLGLAGRETYADWHQTADDFARSYRELVERVLEGAR